MSWVFFLGPFCILLAYALGAFCSFLGQYIAFIDKKKKTKSLKLELEFDLTFFFFSEVRYLT